MENRELEKRLSLLEKKAALTGCNLDYLLELSKRMELD